MNFSIGGDTPIPKAVQQILKFNEVDSATLNAFFFEKDSSKTPEDQRIDQIIPISTSPLNMLVAMKALELQALAILQTTRNKQLDAAVGISNLVFKDGQILCLPMMDITALPDMLFQRDLEQEGELSNIIAQHFGPGILVSSGISYHAYGFTLIEWKDYVKALQALNNSEIRKHLDQNYIANVIARGYACLRLRPSLTTDKKPTTPFVLQTF